MVISTEVKDPVYEQDGHLLIERMASLPSLPPCRGDRDHHIAKERRANLLFRLAHCKGQRVGRKIFPSIFSIESTHTMVAHQIDTELRLRFTGS